MSQPALRDCSEEVREESGYIGVLQQRPGSRNIKRLLLIKENQISQVNEFTAFLCLRRCKSLGSLKSFLGCAPQGQYPVFLHSASALGGHLGVATVAKGLMAATSFVY